MVLQCDLVKNKLEIKECFRELGMLTAIGNGLANIIMVIVISFIAIMWDQSDTLCQNYVTLFQVPLHFPILLTY